MYIIDNVDISILSIDGDEILKIEGSEKIKAGRHQVVLQNLQFEEGVYFCKLVTENEEKVIKVVAK